MRSLQKNQIIPTIRSKDTGKVLTTSQFHTIFETPYFRSCMSSYSLFHIKLITVGYIEEVCIRYV